MVLIKKQKGSILVEMLISIGILSTVSFALIVASMGFLNMSKQSTEIDIATQLAEMKLEPYMRPSTPPNVLPSALPLPTVEESCMPGAINSDFSPTSTNMKYRYYSNKIMIVTTPSIIPAVDYSGIPIPASTKIEVKAYRVNPIGNTKKTLLAQVSGITR